MRIADFRWNSLIRNPHFALRNSSMSSPRDKRLELVLQSMEALPTLPAVAMRVLSAVSNPNTSAAELTRIISSDAPLSARLLQLTRRADSGVRSESADLGKAIVLLGFEAVRAAVLAVAVFDSFRGPAASTQSGGFDRAQFLETFHRRRLLCRIAR